MGLPWVRLDSAMPDNPKIVVLLGMKEGHRAAFVWCCGLAYAGKHGTDGFIQTEILPRINGRRSDADRLVDAGLWRHQPGGWLILGWDEFQMSNEETQARRVRAQAAAQARWHPDAKA